MSTYRGGPRRNARSKLEALARSFCRQPQEQPGVEPFAVARVFELEFEPFLVQTHWAMAMNQLLQSFEAKRLDGVTLACQEFFGG